MSVFYNYLLSNGSGLLLVHLSWLTLMLKLFANFLEMLLESRVFELPLLSMNTNTLKILGSLLDLLVQSGKFGCFVFLGHGLTWFLILELLDNFVLLFKGLLEFSVLENKCFDLILVRVLGKSFNGRVLVCLLIKSTVLQFLVVISHIACAPFYKIQLYFYIF